MKYFININQWVLSKSKLDILDASILEYLRDICSSENKHVNFYRVDGFTWVSMQKLLDEMPMLGFKSRKQLSRRLNHLEDDGWILKMVASDSKIMVKLTDKVDTIKSDKSYQKFEIVKK